MVLVASTLLLPGSSASPRRETAWTNDRSGPLTCSSPVVTVSRATASAALRALEQQEPNTPLQQVCTGPDQLIGTVPRTELTAIASSVQWARARADAILGQWSVPAVVLAPSSSETFSRVAGQGVPALSAELAAVTTGPESGPGSVIVVQVAALSSLTEAGRVVVLAHELTHLATRAQGGRAVSTWLAEGFADYVGFRDSGLPLSLVAADLAPLLRTGGRSAGLPTTDSFHQAGRSADLAYQYAWVTCRVIAEHWGEAALFELYRVAAHGGSPTAESRTVLALREVLGTDESGLARLSAAYLVKHTSMPEVAIR